MTRQGLEQTVETRGAPQCFCGEDLLTHNTEADPCARMRKWFVLFLFFGG